MTDPVDPPPAAASADPQPPLSPLTPPAPSPASAPAPASGDKLDVGCLLLLGAALMGTALIPAALLLGGAPVIIPGLFALVIGFVTPLLNPMERMSPGKRWAGRGIVFFTLAALIAAGAFYLIRGAGDGGLKIE